MPSDPKARAARIGFRLALIVEAILILGVMVLAGTATDIGRTVALVLLVEVPLVILFAATVNAWLELSDD